MVTYDTPRFEPGQVVVTPAVLKVTSESHVTDCFDRHLSGDWGQCGEEDALGNEEAVEQGVRILSVYPVDPAAPEGPKLWIITEADRSVTTVLLPDDY